MTDDGINELVGGNEERILMEAWMLPNEGDLTDAQRGQAMANFSRYLRASEITPQQVARQLGHPRGTTINELMQGKYRAGSDRHVRKLNRWLEQHARQRAACLTKKYVSIKVAKEIEIVARLVRDDQVMGLIIGASGIGKTHCALALHDKYVGSIYIRVQDGFHTARGITLALNDAVGYTEWVPGGTRLGRAIAALSGSGRFIIIDEAHKLQDRALEVLRDLHDTCGVPILLLATQELLDRLEQNAKSDKGQLYSRFAVWHHLTEDYDLFNGGKARFSAVEIKELYNEPHIRLSPDAVRYLQDVANDLGRGSLRRCEHLLRNAARHARKLAGLDSAKTVTVTAQNLESVESRLRRVRVEHDRVTHRRRVAANATG